MDERLNSQAEIDGLTTRRTVAQGVAAGGLAALFAAVGTGKVLADSGPGNDDTVDDTTADDTTGDDGAVDDTTGDDGVDDGGSGGAVKGHHKSRRRRKGRH